MTDIIMKEETETTKPRTITLELSDADTEHIREQAATAGITVDKLLESFIGDLVDGIRTNGPEGHQLAQEWFERCWMYPEKTFLNFLLEENANIDRLIQCHEEINTYAQDIAEVERGIKEGIDSSGVADCLWSEIMDDDGTPAYSNYYEWLNEQMGYIGQLGEESSWFQEEVQDYWDRFLEWTDQPLEGLSLETELEKISVWKKQPEKELYMKEERTEPRAAGGKAPVAPTFLNFLLEQNADIDRIIQCHEKINTYAQDIAKVERGLEEGTYSNGGATYYWYEAMDDDGTPAYSNYHDWETEQLGYIGQMRKESRWFQEEVQDYWNQYLEWTDQSLEDVSLETELEKISVWNEQPEKELYMKEERTEPRAVGGKAPVAPTFLSFLLEANADIDRLIQCHEEINANAKAIDEIKKGIDKGTYGIDYFWPDAMEDGCETEQLELIGQIKEERIELIRQLEEESRGTREEVQDYWNQFLEWTDQPLEGLSLETELEKISVWDEQPEKELDMKEERTDSKAVVRKAPVAPIFVR